MANILDAAGHKMGTIGEDGKVRNLANVEIGRVLADDRVHNAANALVGYFANNGYVYKGSTHVGTVHGDGLVYDEFNHLAGKIVGDHIQSGGAALLLLVK